MFIAQITDTHIPPQGEKTLAIAPMAENLSACVTHINEFKPAVDLVLLSGDITHSGKAEEYEHALSLLNRLNAPWYVIPGNHDDRKQVLKYFSPLACSSVNSAHGSEYINYVIDDFEVRLIALDSTRRGQPGGQLCRYRLSWLEQRLEEQKDRPTIIFMHHPPLKLSVRETDFDGFSGAQNFARIIEKYSNIERIICGHVHLSTFSRFGGTIVSTAPSPGMHLLLDLSLKLPSQFLLRNPAYQLHHWTEDKYLVSHTIEVNSDTRSFLF